MDPTEVQISNSLENLYLNKLENSQEMDGFLGVINGTHERPFKQVFVFSNQASLFPTGAEGPRSRKMLALNQRRGRVLQDLGRELSFKESGGWGASGQGSQNGQNGQCRCVDNIRLFDAGEIACPILVSSSCPCALCSKDSMAH